MRDLISDGLVSEHTRAVRGEERRQKTWQLTEEGRKIARNSIEKLRSMKILIRDKKGKLLVDYRIPVASDLPMIDTEIVEVPNPSHPFGVRGVGEAPIVAPLAVCANAVSRSLDMRITDLPMSPPRLLDAIEG